MDLETENRIASILLREAAELRRQAEQEGVLAYLRKPTVRGRPNSRFLSATVRGIQQANRAVEVNEMWRLRQKELELDDKHKGRSRDESSHGSRHGDRVFSGSKSKRRDSNALCSSSKRHEDHDSMEEEGLRDEDVEEFLHSRIKRGRGSVGSRMDETGPYLPRSSESEDGLFATSDRIMDGRRQRAVLVPERPSYLKTCESSDESSDEDERRRSKKDSSEGSKKRSKKYKSKETSRDKKKKKKKREEEEKRHKH